MMKVGYHNLWYAGLLIVWLSIISERAAGFAIVSLIPPQRHPSLVISSPRLLTRQYVSNNSNAEIQIPLDLQKKIQTIAKHLWGKNDIPTLKPFTENDGTLTEGEATLNDDISFSQRADIFYEEAINGCPKAQHSYALLLWNGFGGVEQDPEASARFHAAAAFQNHLDGMALLGACLRTGSGMEEDEALGIKLINYCASQGNPTGVNKKAALVDSYEEYRDEYEAVRLYEECYESGRVNAMLLFNLGWCLVNGEGVDRKDVGRGIDLWKEAANMAPDEGSEEAVFGIYEAYKRDDPQEAEKWLDMAVELGYDGAIEERMNSNW